MAQVRAMLTGLGVSGFGGLSGSDGDSSVDARSVDGGGWLEVVNRYQWIHDPHQGRFRVYLDGKAAGWAPLSGSLRVPVSPGRHVVRVRLWWYLSPRVGAGVGPGQAVRLEADIARELPVHQRMLLTMFRPFHSLSLTVGAPGGSGALGEAGTADEHLGAGGSLWAPGRRRRARAAFRAARYVTLAGLLSMYVGVHADALAVVIAGAVLACSGAGITTRGMVLVHRTRDRNP
jgi:hypothetical protein